MVGRQRRWCSVSFLETLLLEYLTSGVVLVVVVLLLQGLDLCSGTFLFIFFFFLFLDVCISVMTLGFCVVAEAGCNCYLRDINIYSLSKRYVTSELLIFFDVPLSYHTL